jgi:hypothetical protein
VPEKSVLPKYLMKLISTGLKDVFVNKLKHKDSRGQGFKDSSEKI